jgi:hypothetical protein
MRGKRKKNTHILTNTTNIYITDQPLKTTDHCNNMKLTLKELEVSNQTFAVNEKKTLNVLFCGVG